MIQSYKKKFKTEESYDTIVIGSGILGLTAVVVLHFMFNDFMTDYDPCFDPSCD